MLSFELCGNPYVSEDNVREFLISGNYIDLISGHSSGISDYQTIAKFLNTWIFCEMDETNAGITSYLKDDKSGIIFHVAWYSDGVITTQINGPNQGHQIVFLGDDIMTAKVIGMAYSCSREDSGITHPVHQHPWGSVHTTSIGQGIGRTSSLEELGIP
ncbi:MAG: hypothetical protein WB791_08470 [Waddliaceae bacterium]